MTFPLSQMYANLLWLTFLLFSFTPQSKAQNTGSVTGTVFDTETNKPLGFATVFIAQTTFATTAFENGTFNLNSLPAGKHELVVSFLGYETLSYVFTLQPGQRLPVRVGLTPKPNALQEVVIKPDPNWRQHYNLFIRNFLGQSVLARQARILNPEVLHFDYTPATNVLTAEASEALIIENKELGYKLHFLLKDFNADFRNGQIFHAGYPRFEAMVSRSTSQQKRWQKARLKAYNGSLMHFVRALHARTLEQEGFNVRRLQRLPNPNRPPEAQIQAGLKRWWPTRGPIVLSNSVNGVVQDSLNYWHQMSRLSKMVEVLHREPVPYESMVQAEPHGELLRLQFQDYLQVVYTGEKEEPNYIAVQPFVPNRKSSVQTSVLTLLEPYTYLEPNGMILNPYSFLVEGYWGWEKLGEMLPLDYNPLKQ